MIDVRGVPRFASQIHPTLVTSDFRKVRTSSSQQDFTNQSVTLKMLTSLVSISFCGQLIIPSMGGLDLTPTIELVSQHLSYTLEAFGCDWLSLACGIPSCVYPLSLSQFGHACPRRKTPWCPYCKKDKTRSQGKIKSQSCDTCCWKFLTSSWLWLWVQLVCVV